MRRDASLYVCALFSCSERWWCTNIEKLFWLALFCDWLCHTTPLFTFSMDKQIAYCWIHIKSNLVRTRCKPLLMTKLALLQPKHDVTRRFSPCFWVNKDNSPEENAEKLTQVHVVRCLFKPQPTTVVQVHGKLCWEPLEEKANNKMRSVQNPRKVMLTLTCSFSGMEEIKPLLNY